MASQRCMATTRGKARLSTPAAVWLTRRSEGEPTSWRFAVIRASLHKHGLENDKLCRRYSFLQDTVAKSRMSAKRKGPPKMLFLREMLSRVPEVLSGQIALLGGVDGVKAGEYGVLMKERGVMVIGLSLLEWRLLLEKPSKMEMHLSSGVEEAVVRGLSQSESDDQADLKLSWNAWALKLCEAEEGTPQLRGKCLLQRTVLLLAQNSFQKAIDSSGEVMRIQPANKHAAALNATALHKIGRKKEAASAVTELIGAFQRSEDQHVQDELGAPLELVVSLLVEMHRTKEALRLLSQLLSRVSGPRHQPLFFGLARLYAKHGLNKDALVLKLPQLCTRPPDQQTWDLLKSMAEYTPAAVEPLLQSYIDEEGPGRFTHVPQITVVMCKLFGADGSASNRALKLLQRFGAQVTPDRPEDLKIIVEDLRAFMSSNISPAVRERLPRAIESLLLSYCEALTAQHTADAWEMPGDLMKRAFNGQPPVVLLEQLQRSCLRLPLTSEKTLWVVFRHLSPDDSGVALVRTWLLQNGAAADVDRMERCARHFHMAKGAPGRVVVKDTVVTPFTVSPYSPAAKELSH